MVSKMEADIKMGNKLSYLPKQKFGLQIKVVSSLGFLVVIAMLAISGVVYWQWGKVAERQTIELLRMQLENLSDELSLLIRESTNDLLTLKDLSQLQGLARAIDAGGVDPISGEPVAHWKNRLQSIFSAHLKHHPIYRQIRYFDSKSNEHVRAIQDNGKITIVPNASLQNKTQYEFFLKTLAMPEGSVYYSDLNLSRDGNLISLPYLPVFRIAVPVYVDKQVKGILVINLAAEDLLNTVIAKTPGVDTFVLNQEGYFLLHPDPDKRFGFDLSHGNKLSPLAARGAQWPKHAEQGAFLDTDNGEVVDANHRDRYWELLYQTPASVAFKDLHGSKNIILVAGAIMLLLALITISWYISRTLIKPITLLANAARQLNAHDMTFHVDERLVKDELYTLYCIFNRFAEELKAFTKKLESQVELRTAHLSSVVNNLVDGLIVFNEEGIIESINAASESLFGYSQLELIGSHINKLLPKLDLSKCQKNVTDGLENNEHKTIGRRFELEGLNKEGRLFPADIGISEIGAVRPRFFIITVHDITERKQTELALRETDRRKNEFLALLGHELRNPLAPIRNAVQVLKTQSTSDSTLDWCGKIIDRQVNHMAQLLDDLLDVARIMQDKITLKIELLDFTKIVDYAIETSSPLIEARKQELVISRPEASLWIKGDRVRLVQILSNLLNNAAKFTDDKGKITLKLTQKADQLVLKVQDTGIGISPEMLPYIFDLFTQVEPSLARSQGGLGVGLTLVRRLVEMHGGTISAASAGELRGSEFTVCLPLAKVSSTKKPVQPTSLLPSAKLRILVVDDYIDGLESLALLLQIEGHEVETADCGLKALEKAQTFQPQVVLLDIGLPDLSGYEVAERLRELPETRTAFLIAISGYGGTEYLEQSKFAGFDAYLLKPIKSSKLSALLATAADRMAVVGQVAE
jgi:PAS domain S-box-containing protein